MDQLTRCFSAWRVYRAGSREVLEGLVRPEHRAPSSELTRALEAWPHAHYWARNGEELVLIRPLGAGRAESWLLHLGLFLLTVLCVLGAGAALTGYYPPQGESGMLSAMQAGGRFFLTFLTGPVATLVSGWTFALPLLAILLVHELGHYFAARRYEIDVSPPYFLPVPPTLSPIGSLGAFLRLRSPVLDRRQLVDVGAAGPLAGFVVVLLVLAWGYATSDSNPASSFTGTYVEFAGQRFLLGDSLLTLAFRRVFLPEATTVHLSLTGFAGWAGALITGLNLLPLSQLDGGHIAYGLTGRWQKPLGLVALLGLIGLSLYWSPWLIWVVITLLVGGWRWTHPSVMCPERPVPAGRRLVGLFCIAVFVGTFVPVPFP
jgi:Zn-dependent protease